MQESKNRKRSAKAPAPATLTDADITSAAVDRRSFLTRAVVGGSIVAAAALTAACPGGTDSDGAGDAEAPTDSDQSQ